MTADGNGDSIDTGRPFAGPVTRVEFFFDPMCPWAYQTSVWIRDVRTRRALDISWRFFSLEEINRPEGKRHPWERPIGYGWTPMRVAAWLRRIDMDLCDRWYAVAGRALHVDARRPYEADVARQLLAEIGAPADTWDVALADPTTHDDVLADHRHAVEVHAGFGVPIIVFPEGRPLFGPVVVPAPTGAEADRLWDLCATYATVPGLYELKTPKSWADLDLIATAFEPCFRAREWQSIQTPAP
jgi:2-hydroxychromene-2-carboxylate isomerase